MSNRNDLPSQSSENFLQRVRETLQTYLGRQGDPLDRGLTLRDLLESGIAQLKPGQTLRPGQAVAPIAPGPAVTDEPDLAPPPTPSGFTVTSAISHVFIEHDPPLYLQGHGHLRTRVYGKAVADGDPLPTFGDAAELAQFSGTVYSLPTNPATTWHLWIKWETRDGVLSVAPAGGVNGLAITTGQDVTLLVDALTGDGNPFAILREPTTIDGVLFPAGIYSQQAFLKDAQVTNAKIANLAVDDAKIANLSVSKLTAGSLAVGEYIQSTGFVSGSAGFRIDGNGTAEFSNGTFRGTVVASAGAIGGSILGTDFLRSTNFVAGSAGWRLKSDGTAEFGAASIRGQITASQIDANGLTITDSSGNPLLVSGTGFRVGYSGNVVLNGDFTDGVANVVPGANTTGLTVSIGRNYEVFGVKFFLRGEGTATVTAAGTPAAAGQTFDADIKNGTEERFSVTAGRRYEASAWLGISSAQSACVALLWYDAAGTLLSTSTGSAVTKTVSAPAGIATLSDLAQSTLFVTAPTSAVSAKLVIRVTTSTTINPGAFFSRVFFSEATPSQTVPSPWSPGRGITQITASNASTYIADLAVNTLQIAGNAVTVPVYATSASSVTISTFSSDGSTNTWYDIVSVVIDYGTVVSTAKGLIGFTIQHGSGGGGYWAIRWQVIRGDGTVIGFGEQSVSNNDIGKSTVSATVFDNAANSGARTYKLQIANYGNVGSARVVDAGAVIFGMGAKK